MIWASRPVAPRRHWRGHLIGRQARCQRHATTTRQASSAARPRRSCRRCQLPPVCLAPRLAPQGQEREHASYFVTGAEPHPATSGSIGRRGPRRDTLRRSDCSQAVNLRAEANFEKSTFTCIYAPRAGLEPAAYCLGGRSVRSLDMAGRGLVCHPPAMSVAGRGLAWPGAGGRWLPVWLPGFVSAANLQQSTSASLGAIDDREPDAQPRGLRVSRQGTPRRSTVRYRLGFKPACRRLPPDRS